MSTMLIVGIYVDDLAITGAEYDVQHFKEEMKRLINMSDLRMLRYYLRLEVNQERGRTTIIQVACTGKLVERACMVDYHAVHSPIEALCNLSKESPEKPMDATFYFIVIRSLRYLVHTRPDILFAVRFLRRFMEAPTSDHLAAITSTCYST